MRKALLHLKTADPIMGRLIEQIGPYAIAYSEPNFETLVRSIVGQQLSGKVAKVIFGRLAAACGDAVTPEAILKLRMQKLRAIGLSKQKIEYIRDLARRTVSGEVEFAALALLADNEIHTRLTAIKGIGPWTVHMFLMFALRRVNVMPVADLGIQVAIQKAYGLAARPKPKEVAELAAKWHPFCTVASWYLWRSLGDGVGM
jgi:DNA-3-methyladenine glycosylase II